MKLFSMLLAMMFLHACCDGLAFAAPGSTQVKVTAMHTAATTTATSEHFTPWGSRKTFHCTGTTTAGSGAATIVMEGSDVDSSVTANWVTLGTITLTLGTASTGDGFASESSWRFVRSRISAISGTNGSVNCYLAVE